jgi:hypothetical protein
MLQFEVLLFGKEVEWEGSSLVASVRGYFVGHLMACAYGFRDFLALVG